MAPMMAPMPRATMNPAVRASQAKLSFVMSVSVCVSTVVSIRPV